PKDKLKVDAPENAPDLTITFVIDVSGVPLSIRQSIRHKEIDPSIGEIYQPLTVAPPVVFEIPKRTMMLVNKQDRQLKFAVKGLTDSTEVTVRLIAPAGLKTSWTEQRIKFGKSGEVKALEVTLSEKGRFESGELRFEVVTSTGTYSFGQSQVKYEHIRTQTWFPAANLKIRALEVSGNTGTIGYIPGPGDEVAECLQEIGFTVKKLSDQELQNADLGGYKAIICGIRTYNTNDRMALLQPALNRYIENGGTYIVQYQTNNFIGGTKSGIAPVKLTLGRERVTREEATVKILDPAQPLFTTPNAIGERDFQSWVQERGLYFASEWDASLKPVFEMNDPGEKVQQGSTLIGRYGQGEYIYSGLSFFRQLPAGVPGAYRLLVNMINLK
ncbi:MAG: LmbE family protein, partial [Bacteroidota bacterium]